MGRTSFIEEFSDFLLSGDLSKHVCIDGVWGSGKTTTVLGIIQHLQRSSSAQDPLILYVDSWKLEHYENPNFALLKVIKDKSEKIFSDICDSISNKSIKINGVLNILPLSFSLDSKSESSNNQILHSAEYIDTLNQLMVDVIQKYKEGIS